MTESTSVLTLNKPFMRRLITRLLGIVPSAIVAIVFGKQGIDTLLVCWTFEANGAQSFQVGSQVVLSFILPFVVFPLVYLTSSPMVMTARDGDRVKYFHNGPIMASIGYLIFVIVIAANGYGIVQLARG